MRENRMNDDRIFDISVSNYLYVNMLKHAFIMDMMCMCVCKSSPQSSTKFQSHRMRCILSLEEEKNSFKLRSLKNKIQRFYCIYLVSSYSNVNIGVDFILVSGFYFIEENEKKQKRKPTREETQAATLCFENAHMH